MFFHGQMERIGLLPSKMDDLRMKTNKPSFWLSCPLLHLYPMKLYMSRNHFKIASRTISTLEFLEVYTYDVSPLATSPETLNSAMRCFSWITLSETTKWRCLSFPTSFLNLGVEGHRKRGVFKPLLTENFKS